MIYLQQDPDDRSDENENDNDKKDRQKPVQNPSADLTAQRGGDCSCTGEDKIGYLDSGSEEKTVR